MRMASLALSLSLLQHNFDLLKKLVLPDGSTLRCNGPGRPTRDVLFHDVNGDGRTALKVWNKNEVTGLVGVFNVQGARWDREKRAYTTHASPAFITCEVRPADVEGLMSGAAARDELIPARAAAFRRSRRLAASVVERTRRLLINTAPAEAKCAVFSHCGRKLLLLNEQEAFDMRLGRREWELFTLSPVKSAGDVTFAPLGLMDMLNGGGAVVASALSSRLHFVHATVSLRATGQFSAYCQPAPTIVQVDGERVPFTHDEVTGLLTVPLQALMPPRPILAWRSNTSSMGGTSACSCSPP